MIEKWKINFDGPITIRIKHLLCNSKIKNISGFYLAYLHCFYFPDLVKLLYGSTTKLETPNVPEKCMNVMTGSFPLSMEA